MAKQFGLNQSLRQRRAVNRDQRAVPTCTQAMEAFRDQFLAGSAFPHNQHWPIERCGAACALNGIKKSGRLSNELMTIAFHFQILAYFTIVWQ
jgi:hypothetical protein